MTGMCRLISHQGFAHPKWLIQKGPGPRANFVRCFRRRTAAFWNGLKTAGQPGWAQSRYADLHAILRFGASRPLKAIYIPWDCAQIGSISLLRTRT